MAWLAARYAQVELQKRASRFLHIQSSRTMELAESLYNKGCAWRDRRRPRPRKPLRRRRDNDDECRFISYPRTETEVFKAGTQLHALVDNLRVHRVLGRYAAALLDEVCVYSLALLTPWLLVVCVVCCD